MVGDLLRQREQLISVVAGIEEIINAEYRKSFIAKVGEDVMFDNKRGVLCELSYFTPPKVRLYRNNGKLSKTHRIVRDISKITSCKY